MSTSVAISGSLAVGAEGRDRTQRGGTDMAESDIPTRRRARRSTQASRKLAEARQRNAAQLAAQREQEQRVEGALDAFFGAGDQIAAAEDDCRRKIEPHERA